MNTYIIWTIETGIKNNVTVQKKTSFEARKEYAAQNGLNVFDVMSRKVEKETRS